MPKTIELGKLYDPTKKQTEAHTATERYLLYGGAYGGGKTAWLCNESINMCLKYSGNVGYLGRLELTKFKTSTLLQLLKFLPPDLILQHHQTDNYIKLRNGSLMFYGGLQGDNETTTRISNMELGFFAIDQAEEVSEMQFLLLAGRLRLPLAGIHYHGFLTANPDPGWLRDRFIENVYPDHRFIPALPKDNIEHLPADYEQKLREIYPEEMCKRLLEGNWDIDLGTNYLIPYSKIREAVQRKLEASGDKVAGFDISRYGNDKTVFLVRQGDKVLHIESWAHQDTTFSAGRGARLIREHKPAMTYVDSVGLGVGVFDPLKNEGFPVTEVNVGEMALDKEIYANRRAEYFRLLAKRFEEGKIDIPDNAELCSQLAGIKYKYDTHTRLQIESKENMRRHGGKSPDFADALMLAFCHPDEATSMGKIPVTHWG